MTWVDRPSRPVHGLCVGAVSQCTQWSMYYMSHAVWISVGAITTRTSVNRCEWAQYIVYVSVVLQCMQVIVMIVMWLHEPCCVNVSRYNNSTYISRSSGADRVHDPCVGCGWGWSCRLCRGQSPCDGPTCCHADVPYVRVQSQRLCIRTARHFGGEGTLHVCAGLRLVLLFRVVVRACICILYRIPRQ